MNFPNVKASCNNCGNIWDYDELFADMEELIPICPDCGNMEDVVDYDPRSQDHKISIS